MATWHWDAENGATAGDETTITNANGGTNGPTVVNRGTGATAVFDSAQAAHGSYSVRLATGATSTTANLVFGPARHPSPPSQAWYSFYVYFDEITTNRSVARVRGDSGSVQILRLHRTADGRLELRDSGNSVAATGTVGMPADQWVRIEIHAVPGASSTCTARWYAGDSTTLGDEVSALDNYSTAATVDDITVGNIANGADITAYWVDDVRFSDTDWLGPVSGGTTHDAAAALSGTAGLAATGAADKTGSAALDGAAALSGAGAVEGDRSASLAGTATLQPAPMLEAATAAALDGTSGLAGPAVAEAAATAGLDAETALAAAPVLDAAGSAGLSGTAALGTDATLETAVTVGLAAAGTLTAAGGVETSTTGVLDAAGALTGIADTAVDAATGLAGVGLLRVEAGVNHVVIEAGAALDAVGVLAGVGWIVHAETGSGLAGAGALAAAAVVEAAGSVLLDGAGALDASGVGVHSMAAVLSGVGALGAAGVAERVGAAALSGVGALAAASEPLVPGVHAAGASRASLTPRASRPTLIAETQRGEAV